MTSAEAQFSLDTTADPVADPLTIAVDLTSTVYVKADPRDRFFDTAHLTKELNRRTVRGGAVTITAQGLKFCIRMGSTAVLARLLTPADFGLIAMVTVITGLVEMFKDAGLSMATVQSKQITYSQVSTLFWINVGLAIIFAGLTAALAPLVAWFYHEPKLFGVVIVLSCSMFFSGLSLQHQAVLRRKMQFKALGVLDILSLTFGATVAIILALRGYGYWSLVWMSASTSFCYFIAALPLAGWIPAKPSAVMEVIPLLRFGGALTAINFVNQIYRTADNFFIGYEMGPSPAGIYTRAYGLLLQPWQQLVSPLSSAVEPALCRTTSNPKEFRSLYIRSASIALLCTCCLSYLLFAEADPIVEVLLGKKWSEVAPVIRVMSPTAFFICIQVIIHRWLLLPFGLTGRLLGWITAQTGCAVLIFALIANKGPHTLAIGVLAIEGTSAIAGMIVLTRRTIISAADLAAISIPIVIGGAISGGLYESALHYNIGKLPSLFAGVIPFLVLGVKLYRSCIQGKPLDDK